MFASDLHDHDSSDRKARRWVRGGAKHSICRQGTVLLLHVGGTIVVNGRRQKIEISPVSSVIQVDKLLLTRGKSFVVEYRNCYGMYVLT